MALSFCSVYGQPRPIAGAQLSIARTIYPVIRCCVTWISKWSLNCMLVRCLESAPRFR